MINWLATRAQNDKFYSKIVNVVPLIVFSLAVLADTYVKFDMFFLAFAGLFTLCIFTMHIHYACFKKRI